ncbi:hypothetical protein TNCV_868721 [Trichonephila clavipes]|nr:hypothetical protein TNCV_868721 [Trichonephila clavipes]
MPIDNYVCTLQSLQDSAITLSWRVSSSPSAFEDPSSRGAMIHVKLSWLEVLPLALFVVGIDGVGVVFVTDRGSKLQKNWRNTTRVNKFSEWSPAFTQVFSGCGSQVVKVSDSWLVCHEFQPSIVEDPPFRGERWTFNLSRAQTSARWCGVPPQVSSSSLDHGSKLRGSSPKALILVEQCDVNIHSLTQVFVGGEVSLSGGGSTDTMPASGVMYTPALRGKEFYGAQSLTDVEYVLGLGVQKLTLQGGLIFSVTPLLPAPEEFYLYPRLKMNLKGHRFVDLDEVIQNAARQLKDLTENEFQECFEQLY